MAPAPAPTPVAPERVTTVTVTVAPPVTPRKFRLITFYLAGDPGYEAAKYFAELVRAVSVLIIIYFICLI